MSPYVCDCTNVVYMFCVYCIYYYVNKFEARSLFSTSHFTSCQSLNETINICKQLGLKHDIVLLLEKLGVCMFTIYINVLVIILFI